MNPCATVELPFELPFDWVPEYKFLLYKELRSLGATRLINSFGNKEVVPRFNILLPMATATGKAERIYKKVLKDLVESKKKERGFPLGIGADEPWDPSWRLDIECIQPYFDGVVKERYNVPDIFEHLSGVFGGSALMLELYVEASEIFRKRAYRFTGDIPMVFTWPGSKPEEIARNEASNAEIKRLNNEVYEDFLKGY